MRRASVILAALSLAACKVDVEGASCLTPGSTAECPDGQACGGDKKCSTRAGGCIAACAQQGLLCRTTDYTCTTCPTNPGPEFAVDPEGSVGSARIAPTGLAQPQACRFKRLGDALAAANGTAAVVRVYGNAGAAFGLSTGETFPLTVPAGVTLDGTSVPGFMIQGDAASAVSVLAVQGTMKGVAVANLSMTGNGIDMTCGATGSPALIDVTVSAPSSHPFAKAITFSGGCGALLQRIDASGASGAALDVTETSGTPITIAGGRFHLSGVGIQLKSGTLVVQRDGVTNAEIANNTATGIEIAGSIPVVDVTLTSAIVAGNGGAGVVLDTADTTSRFVMEGCDVYTNGLVSPRLYGPGTPQRSAGGVFIRQPSLDAPKFVFQSNRVFGNGGDQLAFESDGTWSIASASCGATSNTLVCVSNGSAAVAIASGGPGSVNATASVWPNVNWNTWVFGNVTSAFYCNGLMGPPPPPPTCP